MPAPPPNATPTTSSHPAGSPSAGRPPRSRLLERIVAGAVTAFFLAMVSSLVWRYSQGRIDTEGVPPLDTGALAETWTDSEEWMVLRYNRIPVGTIRTTARRVQLDREGGVLAPTAVAGSNDREPPPPAATPARMAFHVAMLSDIGVGLVKARIVVSALLNDRLLLDRFTVDAWLGGPGLKMWTDDGASGAGGGLAGAVVGAATTARNSDTSDSAAADGIPSAAQIAAAISGRPPTGTRPGEGRAAAPAGEATPPALRIEGIARTNRILLKVRRAEAPVTYHSVQLRRPVSLAEGLRPIYLRSDLKPGDRYTVPVFDPLWDMKGGTMVIEVKERSTMDFEGRPVEVMRIDMHVGQTISSTWIDTAGRPLLRRMEPLEMRAISQQTALQREPWMATLPAPPAFTIEDFRDATLEKPLQPVGLLKLLHQANPSASAAPTTD